MVLRTSILVRLLVASRCLSSTSLQDIKVVDRRGRKNKSRRPTNNPIFDSWDVT